MIRSRAALVLVLSALSSVAALPGDLHATPSPPIEIVVPGRPSIGRIFEDRRGDLWLGTSRGMIRYDGLRFESMALRGGGNGICEDGLGRIWFASDYGDSSTLFRLDPVAARLDSLPLPVSGQYVHITDFSGDPNGDVWCSTTHGIRRFELSDSTWHLPPAEVQLASRPARVLALQDDRKLWIGRDTNLVCIDLVTERVSSYPVDVREVSEIAFDEQGDVWFSSHYSGALRSLRPTTGEVRNWGDFESINALEAGFDGLIYVGPIYQVGVVGVETREELPGYGLAPRRIGGPLADSGDLHRDRFGNLWAAYGHGVLGRFDGTRTENIESAPFQVSALLEDRSGEFWTLTPSGLRRIEGGQFVEDSCAIAPGGQALVEDATGALWVDTVRVRRAACASDRPIAAQLLSLVGRDSLGHVWFASDSGLVRWNGSHRSPFEPVPTAGAITVFWADDSTSVWIARGDSVWRRSPGGWNPVGNPFVDEQPPGREVLCIVGAPDGSYWLGFDGKVARYRDGLWTRVDLHEFVGGDEEQFFGISSIVPDPPHTIWLSRGVRITNGEVHAEASLTNAQSIMKDSGGRIWAIRYFPFDVTVLWPDRNRPKPVFLQAPLPRVVPQRELFVPVATGYEEKNAVAFAFLIDGGRDTQWVSTPAVSLTDLADGRHALQVLARDSWGNWDPRGARWDFEVDGTPPAPIIALPRYGDAIRDSIVVQGRAADPRFRDYSVEYRRGGDTNWVELPGFPGPVVDGPLAIWRTKSNRLPDGEYELRLSVRDTLGLVGTATVLVVVDDQPPFAQVTSPAVVTAAGGDVYTTDSRVHLYFPPGAVEHDTVRIVARADSIEIPGATLIAPGYAITWRTPLADKKVTLELNLPDATGGLPAGRGLIRFDLDAQGNAVGPPERLGGTWSSDGRRLGAAIDRPGRFAVFSGSVAAESAPEIGELTLTPRAFSPHGTFASASVGIAFHLGRAGSTTVKVYNRAGRLVREVLPPTVLGPGANLVRWDGKDRDGRIVQDGIFLVSVETAGKRVSKPLAVIR